MQVKAEKVFLDVEEKKRRTVGEVFEVSEERGKALLADERKLVSEVPEKKASKKDKGEGKPEQGDKE